MPPSNPVYPIDLTEEEAAFGFEVRESQSGVRAVVRVIDKGLQAVKHRRSDGEIEYAICDETCVPLYAGASSVDELKQRFFSYGEGTENALLLDNIHTVLRALATMPTSANARALSERAMKCDATVRAWRSHNPTPNERADMATTVLGLHTMLARLQRTDD